MSIYANEAGCAVIAHFSNGGEEVYLAHHLQHLMDRRDILWIVDGNTGELLYLSSAAAASLTPVA